MQINGFPVERKKLEELTKAPYNPRKISPEMASALKRSLQEFGNVEPIIWNKQTGHIVGGHQRFDALLSIGETETDVVIVDMPEEREQALNIALNKISGDWDFGTLSDILLSLHDDMRELTGFTEDEIAALLPKQEGLTDPDAVPEVVESVAKLGDIWQLGEHRLMCGDSTDAGSVALLMNGERCDMVFTDPPYGVNYDGGMQFKNGKVLTGQRAKLIADDSDDIYTKAIPMMCEYCDGPIYTWFAGTKAKAIYTAIEKIGDVHSLIVWVKNGGYGAMNANYKQKHEPCLYWKKKGGKLNFTGATTETTVWSIDKDGLNTFHPTQKPVALANKAIMNHSVGLILDLFLGSGSTLIACEQLNRKCYGMELDPHYCDVIIKRWEDFAGKKAVKIA